MVSYTRQLLDRGVAQCHRRGSDRDWLAGESRKRLT